jgi:hypothetical protein
MVKSSEGVAEANLAAAESLPILPALWSISHFSKTMYSKAQTPIIAVDAYVMSVHKSQGGT